MREQVFLRFFYDTLPIEKTELKPHPQPFSEGEGS